MRKRLGALLSLVAIAGSTSPLAAQAERTAGSRTEPVPAAWVGNWVCQTFQPGYNITPPHADPSQPLTNKITTPATVVVRKFSLRADGTYTVGQENGHYTFDAATSSFATSVTAPDSACGGDASVICGTRGAAP